GGGGQEAGQRADGCSSVLLLPLRVYLPGRPILVAEPVGDVGQADAGHPRVSADTCRRACTAAGVIPRVEPVSFRLRRFVQTMTSGKWPGGPVGHGIDTFTPHLARARAPPPQAGGTRLPATARNPR